MRLIEKFICIGSMVLIPGHQARSSEINAMPTDIVSRLKVQSDPKSVPVVLTVANHSLPYQAPYPCSEYAYIKPEENKSRKPGRTFMNSPRKIVPTKLNQITFPLLHRSIDGRKRKTVSVLAPVVTQPAKRQIVSVSARHTRKFNQAYLRQKFGRQNG
ncbi:MAG: hypothetical protein IJV07_04565 [Alphaproteobacteria bacterium]|nr:hypothetical protein [Alphaproteobacteria bacterium]